MLTFSFSLAQECASLLEGTQPSVDLTSIEQSITSATYVQGQTVNATIYQVVDLASKQLYQETTLPGMGEVIMRYQDGQATMQLKGNDMNLPVPPQFSQQLEAVFDNAFGQAMLPATYELVSCDGQQSYADLITGEQVTINTAMPEALGGDMTSSLLFDADGQMLGTYMTLPQMGETLIVYDVFEQDEAGVPTQIDISMYTLGGAEPTLFSETQITTLSYNQPFEQPTGQ